MPCFLSNSKFFVDVYRLGIFIGFASFFIMEKTLRVLGGDEDAASHSHSHSIAPVPNTAKASGVSSASLEGIRSRKSEKTNGVTDGHEDERKPSTSPSKLSAYLNLFGDFVHNM
jgi:zinc transporter 7